MLKHPIYMFLSTFVFVLFTACANSQPAVPVLFTECMEPRPQICTREYKPVCATRDTGIRCVTTPCPSTELKTYGNACTACGDVKVLGYQQGACETGSE